MKNLLLFLLVIFFLGAPSKGHTREEMNIDDIGKLVIGVEIRDNSNKETLLFGDVIKKRIEQIVSNSGYSSSSDYRFFVSPQIIVESKDVAEGGMKNLYVVRGHLYLTLQDENTIYSTISLPFKGSGIEEATALREALNTLSLNSIQPLFLEGKQKIYTFFRLRKDAIFAYADKCVMEGNYDEAVACLLTIPEEISDLYTLAIEKSSVIIEMKYEHERQVKAQTLYEANEEFLAKAKSFVASNCPQDALYVLSYYRKVDVEQNHEYEQLVAKAEAQVREKEAITRQDKLRKEKADYNIKMSRNKLESHRIDAMKAVALAYIQNHPSYRYYIYNYKF